MARYWLTPRACSHECPQVAVVVLLHTAVSSTVAHMCPLSSRACTRKGTAVRAQEDGVLNTENAESRGREGGFDERGKAAGASSRVPCASRNVRNGRQFREVGAHRVWREGIRREERGFAALLGWHW